MLLCGIDSDILMLAFGIDSAIYCWYLVLIVMVKKFLLVLKVILNVGIGMYSAILCCYLVFDNDINVALWYS